MPIVNKQIAAASVTTPAAGYNVSFYNASGHFCTKDSAGNARVLLVPGSSTVAALPVLVAADVGARAFVTDANSTTFLAVAAGVGANKASVVWDGTQWILG